MAPLPEFEWSQERGTSAMEITFAVSGLPAGARGRDFEVTIKESDILCIKHQGNVVLQQRLHDDVASDITSWAFEGGNKVTVELQKKEEDMWPCLLRQPLKMENDDLFLNAAELDHLFAYELPKLPALTADELAEATAALMAPLFEEVDEDEEKKSEKSEKSDDVDVIGSDEGKEESASEKKEDTEEVPDVDEKEESAAAEEGSEKAESEKAESAKADSEKAESEKAESEKAESEKAVSKTTTPRAVSPAAAAAAAATVPPTLDDDDLDALLDEAMDEVVEQEHVQKVDAADADTDAVAEEEDHHHKSLNPKLAESELKGMKEEDEEMVRVLKSLHEEMAKTPKTDVDARAGIEKRVMIVQKMRALSLEIRKLRGRKVCLETFDKVQKLDIRKGRLNTGNLEEEEVELYADDAEKEMTETELLQKGVTALQAGDMEPALHFLRLAALHHDHSVSTCLLHRVYSEINHPAKAAWFALRRAQLEDLDAATNMLVAGFFDHAMRHFPPLMALAVRYYQRAATSGSTHAMLTLAQLFKNGGCSASVTEETDREKLKDIDRFKQWMAQALARGSGNAYFIRCCMHMTGEHDVEKSPKKAMEYLLKVKAVSPEILAKAPGLEQRVKTALEAEGDDEVVDLTTAPRAVSRGGMNGELAQTSTMPAQPAGARARFNQLDSAAGGGAMANMGGGPSKRGMMTQARGGGQAAKQFFERLAKVGAAAYCAYQLAFPFRVVIAPYFFGFVGYYLEALFGSGAVQSEPSMMF